MIIDKSISETMDTVKLIRYCSDILIVAVENDL